MRSARLRLIVIGAAAIGLAACNTVPDQPGNAVPGPGMPPLSAITRASGGPLPAALSAFRFDKADLSFEILPESKRLEGVAKLDLTTRMASSGVTLDLDPNLPVTELLVDGAPARWTNPEGKLSIAFPAPKQPGDSVRLQIRYGGTPHIAVRAPWDGGFVWSRTPDGRPWVATAVQGEGCDLFWPCFDHPLGEPAIVDLHITVPAGLAAPSNGVLLGTRELPDGRRTYDWRVKQPNTYGIALQVGPYERMTGSYRSRHGNDIPIEYWHLTGDAERARGLFAEIPPALDFFEEVIGPYPFADEKVGVVHTPHLGMEHQTINAYGNNYAKEVWGFDWLFQHEFAHEWFANQLTGADPQDFWLHEGFGTYMQPLQSEWRDGEMAYLARMHSIRSGIRNCAPLVPGPGRTFEQMSEIAQGGPGIDVYYKGAWMLHTLRGLVGEKAFLAATRRLIYGRSDPKPGNFRPRYGSSAEFERLVHEETGKDLSWFFDVYLRQAQLPDLVTEERGGRLHLSWKTESAGAFPMPVEVRMGERVHQVPMTGGRGSLPLPAGARYMLDPGGKVLRRSRDVEALQQWQYEQARSKPVAPGAEPPTPPCLPP